MRGRGLGHGRAGEGGLVEQVNRHAGGPPARERTGRRAGFSLIEIVVGTVILIVASGGLVASMLQSRALARSNNEKTLAQAAIERALEQLAGTEFNEVLARFDGDPANDPAIGASPGMHFPVAGLSVQAADPDGFAGRIEFPLTGGALVENAPLDSFGLPRDLDADGLQDGADHSGDYVLLPVRVHVEWRGVSGDRSASLDTLLTAR